MKKLIMLVSFVFAACTVGTDPKPTFVDSNGDGTSDGVDTDGDGHADFPTPNCPTCTPGDTPVCDVPLIDTDNDGIPDGIDLDCDGNIDIPFDFGDDGDEGDPPGGGGGTNQCVSTIQVNGTKHQVSCTDGACECRINDQLTSSCTAPDPSSACSVPGNCCGF